MLVDHHDSYTWSLAHLLAVVTGELPLVVQHDEVTAAEVLAHRHVVLSPGPGHPDVPADFAVGHEVLRAATRPVLGVCLGMQGLVTAYGGRVGRGRPAHGVVETITHDGLGVFAGLPQGFRAVRYHSLVALELPPELVATAWSADGVVMGVRHRELPQEGVQFHPESVLSEHGAALVASFLGGRVSAEPPTELFSRVAAEHPRCFWLDGGGAREWSGRRSLIGWLDEDDVSLTYDAVAREVTRHAGGRSVVVGTDVFAVLEAELARGEAGDQWFGYLGYAARPDLPALVAPGGVPDAVWMRARHVRLFEHPSPVPSDESPGTSPGLDHARPRGASLLDQRMEQHRVAFDRVQQHLHAGNSYEVNLTHRVAVADDVDPVTAYLRLRELNPAPYAGFLQHDVDGARGWLLSSSPERYALIGPGPGPGSGPTAAGGRWIETKPIKGTTPRGATTEEDVAQADLLRGLDRFRAENLMIVDLLRNDLAMVCEPGTVEVPALMQVESYATVHQLVSTVRGRLRGDITTVGALRALFPAGSMTGAPKLRTMEIIAEVEATPRGAYAGAFGWLSADGRADLGVVIRTLTTTGDGVWSLGTGGGITVHSTAAEEWAEATWKSARLMAVFGRT